MSEAIKVRVTRDVKIQIEEYVDIDVVPANTYATPESVAKSLVGAMVAAGQPIAWIRIKEVADPINSYDITAETLSEPSALEPPNE